MHDINFKRDALLLDVAFNLNDKLVEQALSLSRCTSLDELYRGLTHICAALDFDRFLYGAWFSVDGTKKSELILTNYDSRWREKYQRESYVRIDPTVMHAVRSLTPLVWAPDLFSTEAAMNLREEALHYGLANGITFPIHGKDGDVALLSFANSIGDDAQRHNVRRLPLGVLVATLAHESVRQIIQNQRDQVRPTLTQREMEILKWISIGKTTWEISRLLNISEHGVSFHVRKILEKFDVSSRHQAVVKASSLNMLR